MTQPASVPSDGSVAVLWVPSLAIPTAPTAAELNAASVVDLSCYLTGTGLQPSTDEQVVLDPRLCSRQVFERAGRFTDRLTLMYVHNPKAPAENEAYIALAYKTLGLVVIRWGVDFEDPFVATDIVDVLPGECGIQQKQPPEENSVLTVQQTIHIRGAVARDAVVV